MAPGSPTSNRRWPGSSPDRGPLLRFLPENPGRVHSREALLAEVWGEDYGGGPWTSRTVDVHVRRLRHKLGRAERQLRSTVRNVGYGFEG